MSIVLCNIDAPQKLLVIGCLNGLVDQTGRSLVDVAVELLSESFQPSLDDEALLLQIVKVRRW